MGRTPTVVSIAALSVAAWLALWWSDRAGTGLLHAHHLGGHDGSAALGGLLFVAGWTVMTVAMMLPTSLPVVVVLRAMVERHAGRGLLVALVVVGYVVAWSLSGLFVYLAILALERVVSAVPLLQRQTWLVAPALLLVAGTFQFTSLKYRCLDRCRSPVGFVLTHWRGRRPRSEAFTLGLDHGRYCVGCCWALMLLMFAVGAGSLAWMLVLAAVMATEKNVSWGRRMAKPVGAVLLVWGATLLAIG